MSLSHPDEDSDETDNRFHRKRRRRRKPQGQELDHPQCSGGSSSVDDTVRVLLRLRSDLEVEMKRTKTALDTRTARRLQDLIHHLDQVVMESLESPVSEVQGNTATDNHSFDRCKLNIEYNINPLFSGAVSLQETDVTPPSITTYFQDARNCIINGGHFGQPADQNVQKELQRIFWILIFNTGVLFY